MQNDERGRGREGKKGEEIYKLLTAKLSLPIDIDIDIDIYRHEWFLLNL